MADLQGNIYSKQAIYAYLLEQKKLYKVNLKEYKKQQEALKVRYIILLPYSPEWGEGEERWGITKTSCSIRQERKQHHLWLEQGSIQTHKSFSHKLYAQQLLGGK